MGRPRKSEQEEVAKVIGTDKDLQKALNFLDEINPDASDLGDDALSNVHEWIDSGSYALNAICSGSVWKGIPVGRVTGFVGPSGAGKTLIMNKIMANTIKKGYKPVYFDSENALDPATAERLGCDISKIKHAPVEFVEECKHQISNLLTKLIDANLKRKVAIFIDSLGNLLTHKELNDSLEGSLASDMGLKAKLVGSLVRMATTRAAKAEVPVIFSNHIYENPGQLHPTMVKTQSGGLKPLYISSLLVQLSTTNEKITDKSEQSKLSAKISGVNLRCLITKNRFIPPFLETTLYLNYKTGLSKYVGLLDMAIAYGIIENNGATFTIDGTKLGYRASFDDSAEFWENGPLQKLDAVLQKDLTYSNEKYKDLKEQVDNLTPTKEE